MRRSAKIVVTALAVIAVGGVGIALSGWSPLSLLGMVLNSVRSASNAPGRLTVEANPGFTGSDMQRARDDATPADGGSWESYNRTLTSERYSPLDAINVRTVAYLKVLCTYDTQLRESFETGPLMVDGALIGTTAQDIFSIDPDNCRENWRTHEDYKVRLLGLNRGAAYLEGRLFRGTMDGREIGRAHV